MSFDPFTPFNPFNPDVPSDDHEITINEFMQPPFEIWIKNKLNDLFNSDLSSFDEAFDDLVSEGVGNLVFRGEKQCCREHFKEKLLEEVKANKGEVTEVEVPKAPEEGENKLVRCCDRNLRVSCIRRLSTDGMVYLGSQTGPAEVKFEVTGKSYTVNLR